MLSRCTRYDYIRLDSRSIIHDFDSSIQVLFHKLCLPEHSLLHLLPQRRRRINLRHRVHRYEHPGFPVICKTVIYCLSIAPACLTLCTLDFTFTFYRASACSVVMGWQICTRRLSIPVMQRVIYPPPIGGGTPLLTLTLTRLNCAFPHWGCVYCSSGVFVHNVLF